MGGPPQEPEPLEGPRHLQDGGPQGHTPGLPHRCSPRGRASQRLAHTSGAPLCRTHVALFRSFAVCAGLGRIIENHEDQDGKHRGPTASFNLGGRCGVTLLTEQGETKSQTEAQSSVSKFPKGRHPPLHTLHLVRSEAPSLLPLAGLGGGVDI